eukprot:5215490-Pyramimonas_sp.AAC.1
MLRAGAAVDRRRHVEGCAERRRQPGGGRGRAATPARSTGCACPAGPPTGSLHIYGRGGTARRPRRG